MKLCGLWEMIVCECLGGGGGGGGRGEVQGGLVYQSHSDTLSKALCVPTSEREQL